jgi:uncharacterized membrane protein YfcA
MIIQSYKMKKSKFFTLSKRDFFRGLIVAVLTAIGSYLSAQITASVWVDEQLFKRVALTGVVALIAYLLKNLFTNSNDDFLTNEKK